MTAITFRAEGLVGSTISVERATVEAKNRKMASLVAITKRVTASIMALMVMASMTVHTTALFFSMVAGRRDAVVWRRGMRRFGG